MSRDVLIETITLTLTGGVLGFTLGAFFIRMLELREANQLPLGSDIRVDETLMFVAVAAAVLLAVVIAVPIIWFNSSNHLANALKAESRAGTTGRGVIVAQITAYLSYDSLVSGNRAPLHPNRAFAEQLL